MNILQEQNLYYRYLASLQFEEIDVWHLLLIWNIYWHAFVIN